MTVGPPSYRSLLVAKPCDSSLRNAANSPALDAARPSVSIAESRIYYD